MTLIELLVAMSIFTVLGASLVMFLRVGIETWHVGEIRREAFERAQAILDQLEADLSCAFTDPTHSQSDIVDVMFICDRDYNARQRLRFVRTLGDEMRQPFTQSGGLFPGATGDYDYINDAAEYRDNSLRAPGGLQEVVYLLDPNPETLLLWRGIKSPIGGARTLFDEENIYDDWVADRPTKVRRARPIAEGVLYLGYRFWGQDTESWDPGLKRHRSLDWWDSTRAYLEPDDKVAYFDPNSAGEPRDDVFPSRVQVVLVLRPARAVQLAHLTRDLSERDDEIHVDQTRGYPEGAFQYVLIDGEWLRYDSKSGSGFVGVERAQRKTKAATHKRGASVIYGTTFCRVIRIPGARQTVWGKR